MILVGKKAPAFRTEAIVDNQIKLVSLDDFGNRYKLIFFYPLNFTFVCPTEMHALQDKLEEFKDRNVEVLAISVDSIYSHLSWLSVPRSKGGIQGVSYTLLSDLNKKISQDYGVLIEEQGVALRGVFLIDKNNVVQYAAIHNLPLGRNIYEILRVIDAVQHIERNGVVCPANWVPGQKDMKPTSRGLLDYLAE